MAATAGAGRRKRQVPLLYKGSWTPIKTGEFISHISRDVEDFGVPLAPKVSVKYQAHVSSTVPTMYEDPKLPTRSLSTGRPSASFIGSKAR